MGTEFQFGKMKKSWGLMVVMVAHYECAQPHGTVHLKLAKAGPGRGAQWVGVSSRAPKGCRFNPQLGRRRQPIYIPPSHRCSLSLHSLSTPPLKLIKPILR